MIDLVYIVAPIFLIILLGYLLKNFLISNVNFWNRVNLLTYWVLFPCLLFNKTSAINLEGLAIGAFSVALVGGYLSAVLFSYVFGKISRLDAAPLSSVLQGGGRHNSFVALAVVSQLLGEQGEIIGALAVAVMVTFSNVATIIMMTSMLSKNGRVTSGIVMEIIRNPFIVAIYFGLNFNYLGIGNIPVLSDFTAIVGKAALPVALLCVGAGLLFVGAKKFLLPTFISCVGKMAILPLSVFLLARYFELSQVMTIAAVVFASVPTSSTAYALAKQMGGDAPLMAAIISLQTLIAVVTIPLAITLVS